jgi:hypothetical protein
MRRLVAELETTITTRLFQGHISHSTQYGIVDVDGLAAALTGLPQVPSFESPYGPPPDISPPQRPGTAPGDRISIKVLSD